MYSAINRNANLAAEYSVLKPDTNSLSPSAWSKGVRLDSAIQEINQINPKGPPIRINPMGAEKKAERENDLNRIRARRRVIVIGIS